MTTARKETPLDSAEMGDEATRRLRMGLTPWKQLAGSLTTPQERMQAIQRMYEKLTAIYERDPNPVHLFSYPEALEDLPPELLPLAFHRAVQQAKFFPSAGEIRATVASDNAAQIEEGWQRIWHGALSILKGLPTNDHEKSQEFCNNISGAWPAPFVRAIATTGGDDFYRGAKYIHDYHPRYRGPVDDWPYQESPRLAAERIEKRVRDLWEVYR